MAITAVATIDHSGEPATVGERFASLFAEIAAGAGERDHLRRAPHDEVNALKRAGFGVLRLPISEGGAGLRFTELVELVIELARADSNIAHIFRNHFGAVENAIAEPSSKTSRFVRQRSLEGETFGGGFSELGLAQAGGTDFETTFVPSDGHYLLNGTKFYSTGNLYADWLFVTGRLSDGRQASALLPVDRKGVELVDDWDGIGQRLTGSGTTRFTSVQVKSEELVASGDDVRVGTKYRAVFAQLYLSAAIAGIMANIHDDALKLVKARSRNFYHGIADKPRNEPGVQELVGQISTNAWIAQTLVREAAQALEQSQDFERAHGPTDEMRMAASLAAARVKIVVDELGPATASLLFEVGGGQTVREGLRYDRHWRNIKTLSAHNPRIYKLRVIGDHELNGTPLPIGPFF
jgi:alkylation response protein AidB-like acyl-CoA dehydrogenase